LKPEWLGGFIAGVLLAAVGVYVLQRTRIREFFDWLTLQRALAIATALAPFAVPITVAIIANSYAEATAKREANLRLTELAIGILRSEPTDSTRGLRQWARSVVNHALPELPLPAEAESTRIVAEDPRSGLLLSPMPSSVIACTKDRRFCDTSFVIIDRGPPLVRVPDDSARAPGK
jgi:hypothetical protein